MLEPAVIVLRLLQYAGAMVLMGSSLFFVYALPRAGAGSAAEAPWPRKLLAVAATLLAIAALLGIAAQASFLAGSIREGLQPGALSAVIGMELGRAAVLRAFVALVALTVALAFKPSRATWLALAALGTFTAGSLAWMGHGAATDGSGGAVHLVSDVLHSWAAAVWIGALVAFLLLLLAADPRPEATVALHRALHGFSGLGTLLVAVLVATGAVNGWFLVGADRIDGLWSTPYGRLLSLKLLLVVTMLIAAAINRFRLTPALARALDHKAQRQVAQAHLRRSVAIETAVAFGVLALVAWFGTLEPPAAM